MEQIAENGDLQQAPLLMESLKQAYGEVLTFLEVESKL